MTPEQIKQAARDVKNLSYKYFTLLDCIKDQRPELLLADPEIKRLRTEFIKLEHELDARIVGLAGEEE